MKPADVAMEPVEQKASNSADKASPALHWNNTIRFRLIAGLLALLVMLVGSSLGMIWLQGMPMLIEQRHQLNELIGRNLVNSLQQQFSRAETLSRNLAHLVETLPRENELFRQTIPKVLDNPDMRKLVAGGGVWPEPFAFNPALARSSFFWGRNNNNTLDYFDDYNDPTGPGYHHEEWYVPAKLQNSTRSYWSRSYTDPYSLQPMVTCTTPIMIDDQFAGVATVDLRLEGVHELIQNTFAKQPGYAFVVDRNNKFIAFPDMSLVMMERQDKNNKQYQDFIYAQELALHLPVFNMMAEKLALLTHHNESLANRDTETVKQLAAKIADESYQIDKQEARVISHNLQGSVADELNLQAHYQADDDLFLREPVEISIYEMPHTFWKVVVVFPVAETARAASTISRNLSWLTLIGIAVWGALLLLFIWKVFFQRLQFMTQRVMQAAQEDREIVLEQQTGDELGQFAFWYNLRTQQLNEALAQARQITSKLSDENREHQLTASLLEKSLALQHAILDSANLMIISTDPGGQILTCNAGTQKLLGYKEAELVGKIFPHKLIDRQQLLPYQEALYRRFGVQANGFDTFITAPEHGEKEENEWEFVRKDDSRCVMLLTITPVLNPSNQLEGWLAVGNDISHHKQAEEDLRQAIQLAERSSRAKTHFLANMSHELRTPLNAVLGFTRRLQKTLPEATEARHRDALVTIERSAQHLMALIDDLLDISKIESGQMDLQLSEFDLVRLVSEIHEETRPLAEGRPIDYSLHLPHQAQPMVADRKKVKQIVYNLISNSFKATEHGAVDIQLSDLHHDDTISLIITDTGKGISPEDSRKLFQKFSNLNTYVDGKASTGLGLYLTMQLVKLHNGNISFESTPGKGTCFTVKLPLHYRLIENEQP